MNPGDHRQQCFFLPVLWIKRFKKTVYLDALQDDFFSDAEQPPQDDFSFLSQAERSFEHPHESQAFTFEWS